MSDMCEVLGEERLRDLLCHIRDTFALNATVQGIQEGLADLDSLLDALNGESVGTTLEKLAHLDGTKQAIGTAIKAKGQKVSNKDTFRSYADKILAISGGGGEGGGGSGIITNTIVVPCNVRAMTNYTACIYTLIRED